MFLEMNDKKKLDQIKGCMIGGAAGDALGYEIEFDSEHDIFNRFGEQGITAYYLAPYTGKALISDDTQMTMFTATGICFGQTRGALRGVGAGPSVYMGKAYKDWYLTQTCKKDKVLKDCDKGDNAYAHVSWLLGLDDMYHRRAPGTTCLSAMRNYIQKNDYIEEPVNDSKGCGGVMRVAPVGLMSRLYGYDRKFIDMEAAQIAAITHGHSLGYMPAAVLAHVINMIVFSDEEQQMPLRENVQDENPQMSLRENVQDENPQMSLKEIVLDAKAAVNEMFKGDKHLAELNRLIDLAIELSENDKSDLENIHQLGEGWVAEEALAISLYCALKYQHDFSAGIIAAVNHNGDSDSTGAVTGNILGALLGYDAIDDKWKENLELSDVILELAEDLFYGCPVESPYDEISSEAEAKWMKKYCYVLEKKEIE